MLKSLWNQLIPTRSCLQRCILGFCNLPTTTTTRRRLSFHKGNLIEFSLSHSYDFWHYVATPFEVASSPFLPAGEAGHICNTIRQSAPNQHETEGWGYKFTTSSIYIYTIVIWENLEQVSHSHASKNHSLFDSHLIVTPPLHAAPNSPNSPSATRRRKDLQVKGILLQMLARPQGQTVHQHDRRYQMYSPYMTVGQQGPLHHTNEKIALSRSLYATLISDYQTQFTTLIRLKGVFTTKKTLRVLAEKQQSPTGL